MMRILSRNESDLETAPQKRQHERRVSDQCVSEINGRTYPVINWSQGGVLIFADDRQFGTDETIQLNMKFRVNERIVSVPHAGRIIRKGAQRIAIKFDHLTGPVRRAFHQVIDDNIAREFADSQV